MQHVATFTQFFVAPRRVARHRTVEDVEPLRSTPAGAWRNWWNMSVEEPPAVGSYRTRPVGARGRMVERHNR